MVELELLAVQWAVEKCRLCQVTTRFKTQIIAGALSRAPVYPAEEERDILVCTVQAARASNKEAPIHRPSISTSN